jgi:hypothetical protein
MLVFIMVISCNLIKIYNVSTHLLEFDFITLRDKKEFDQYIYIYIYIYII